MLEKMPKAKMNKKIIYNCIVDFTKKDIDKFERANIISEYIENEKISRREFGRRFNVPHSTVDDWLMIKRIEPEQYDKLIDSGYTETDIYRGLRENKKVKVVKDIMFSSFDEEARQVVSKLNKYATSYPHNEKSYHVLRSIRNICNRIEMRIDKCLK